MLISFQSEMQTPVVQKGQGTSKEISLCILIRRKNERKKEETKRAHTGLLLIEFKIGLNAAGTYIMGTVRTRQAFM